MMTYDTLSRRESFQVVIDLVRWVLPSVRDEVSVHFMKKSNTSSMSLLIVLCL